MLNKVVMVGRLAQETELKKTQSGKSVVSTSLAVQRDYKENGEKKADFFPIVVWGKSADNFHSWLKKGQLISVSGRLQRRDYENQQGQRVYVTEIVVEQFYPLERTVHEHTNVSQESLPSEPPVNESDFPF